jgi:hypothetical protein
MQKSTLSFPKSADMRHPYKLSIKPWAYSIFSGARINNFEAVGRSSRPDNDVRALGFAAHGDILPVLEAYGHSAIVPVLRAS